MIIRSEGDAMKTADFESAIHRKVWDCNLGPVGQRPKAEYDASIGCWLLDCPGVHPWWHYWFLSLVHLRPISGADNAVIRTPGAGWELLCFSQSSEEDPNPDDIYELSTTSLRYRMLDWCVQFGSVNNDVEAEAVALACVHAIVTGKASPDSDYQSYWEKAIPEIAVHYATHRRNIV